MEFTLYNICLAMVVFYSALGWLVLTGIKINYGRLKNSFAKIYISPRIGWFLFQIPNLIWAGYFLLYKGDSLTLPLTLFIIHYINRDIIYPLRMKSTTSVPLEICLSAFTFTFANGYIQCIANQQHTQMPVWRTILGVSIFVLGMWINIESDSILQSTKDKILKQGSNRYVRIDKFLFKWISNPNYFGEVIEWIGYAIVSGHPCAWLFAFSTINVLTPAAMVRSKWNKSNIPNYPSERKAIFPFLI